jgi:hypothetical protein
MPSQKPRLSITLEPRLYETLSRMSKVSGNSISSIIGEFMGAIHEPLMRTVALLEAAKDAPEEVKRGLKDTAAGIEHGLGAVLGDAQVQLDMLFSGLDQEEIHKTSTELLGVFGAETEGQTGGGDPQVVTRGSGLAGRKENKTLSADTKRVRNPTKRTQKE